MLSPTGPSEEARLLVVSPLGGSIGPNWLGRQWKHLSTATTPSEAIEAVGPGRRRFDAVLVDLMWNDFDDEWVFDGLDVLAAMEASGHGEWVVFACQGHGFERDYLDEAHARLLTEGGSGQIRALVLKTNPSGVLDAVLAVTAGGIYVDPVLRGYLRPIEQTIHYWFARSLRLPRFAGVLAAGHSLDYARLADVLHTSKGYLQKSPALFADLLSARAEIGEFDHVNLATVARWCGEHAHYIISWCRRHGQKIPEFQGLVDTFVRRRLEA